MNKKNLINLLFDTHAKNKDVKEYLEYKSNPEEKEKKLLSEAMNAIRDEYFPEKKFGDGRISVAKKAISNFSRINPSPYHKTRLFIKNISLITFLISILLRCST